MLFVHDAGHVANVRVPVCANVIANVSKSTCLHFLPEGAKQAPTGRSKTKCQCVTSDVDLNPLKDRLLFHSFIRGEFGPARLIPPNGLFNISELPPSMVMQTVSNSLKIKIFMKFPFLIYQIGMLEFFLVVVI